MDRDPKYFSVTGESFAEAYAKFLENIYGSVPPGFKIEIEEIGDSLYKASLVKVPPEHSQE